MSSSMQKLEKREMAVVLGGRTVCTVNKYNGYFITGIGIAGTLTGNPGVAKAATALSQLNTWAGRLNKCR